MNKKTWALVGYLAASALIASCSGSSNGQNSVAASDSVTASTIDSAQSVQIDFATSALQWKGFKPGGSHEGKLPVSDGKLDIRDGVLHGGYVVLRLDNLTVDDLKPEEGGNKLKEHLLSVDFFDAAKWPKVRFELTNISPEGLSLKGLTELKGNLTLKDVTKNITIPISSVAFDEAQQSYSISSKSFKINRADWNVKYGSKSFFTGLGDNFINDEIELSFLLRTK
ncbi:YceI family protein [Porphyromonas sp.]